MKKYPCYALMTVLFVLAALPVSGGEQTIEDKTAALKKRLENVDKQYADREKLQKEAENDPCLAGALQKRETSIEKMKTHINDMIAATQAGDENKIKELREAEKVLGKELELSNRAIFFAKQAAKHRQMMQEIKNKLAKVETQSPEDQEVQKTLEELTSTFEGLAANPPLS